MSFIRCTLHIQRAQHYSSRTWSAMRPSLLTSHMQGMQLHKSHKCRHNTFLHLTIQWVLHTQARVPCACHASTGPVSQQLHTWQHTLAMYGSRVCHLLAPYPYMLSWCVGWWLNHWWWLKYNLYSTSLNQQISIKQHRFAPSKGRTGVCPYAQ